MVPDKTQRPRQCITTQANAGSSGDAGSVVVSAGALTLVGGGVISSTAGGAFQDKLASMGNAGNVTVSVDGLLSIDGSGSTRPTAIATSTGPGTIGDAGRVTVAAAGITMVQGARISSATAGTGAGGSVDVTTPGTLVLTVPAAPTPASPLRRPGCNPAQAVR